MICNSILGDPFTASASTTHWIAIGSVSGRVGTIPARPDAVALSSDGGALHLLSEASEEGVRGLYSDSSGGLVCVFGDKIVRWSDPCDAKSSDSIELLERIAAHNGLDGSGGVVVSNGYCVAMMSHGNSVVVDLETLQQRRVKVLTGLRFAVPVYFDGKNLVIVQNSEYCDDVVVQIWRFDDEFNFSELGFDVKFSKRKNSYWGFQLNCSGTRMYIVSLHCKLSVWDVEKKEKIKSFQAYGGGVSIVAYLVELDRKSGGDRIITIGSNSVLKVWNGFKCVNEFKLNGSFKMMYPYFLQRFGEYVIYNADDGIFRVHLTFKKAE
jgi:WD40 repeat protein